MSLREKDQLIAQAADGDLEAQLYVGYAFESGLFPNDEEQAYIWYKKAAKKIFEENVILRDFYKEKIELKQRYTLIR